jgi:hemerythrin-like metal-binding protein
MAITWRVQLSIDRGFIDADHKCLISCVNSLESVQPGPAMQREIAAILDRLNACTLVHFEREEEFQHASRFINASAHGRYHASAIGELSAVRTECEREMTATQLMAFQQRVSRFLTDWLIDHITRSDMLMKPFMTEMQSHAKPMLSLAEAVLSNVDGFQKR